MKTTLKKVLSMALALVLLVGALPMGVQAAAADANVDKSHWEVTSTSHKCIDSNCTINWHPKQYATEHWDGKYNSDPVDGICGACGYVINPCFGGHTPGAAATCTSSQVFTVCGTELVGALGVNSETGHNMQQTAARREPTCGAEGSEAVMTCSNGCGKSTGGDSIPATGNHTGGEATCTTKAVCSDCGDSYGEFSTTKHAAADPTKWEHDVNYHWNVCGCANHEIVNKDRHEWPSEAARTASEACTVCGVTREIPNNETTGGTTTEVANLRIMENGVLKYATTGTPNGPVSVAECLSIAGINSANVTNITVSGNQSTTLNGTFTLGAANSLTTIEFTTATPTASYIVYYNVNVDASKDNKTVGSYVSGSTMGDALDKLSTMTITRPGLYPTWFKLAGWYWDRACTNPVRRDTLITEDTVVYAKWERKYNYEVTLKLYTNGNTNTVVKVVDAFAYIQDDGILSNSEVTAIAKQYIKSNNDAPITAYGPFKSGSEWDNYCKYQNRLSTQNQYIAEDDPATVLHVMVHNAKIYNSTSSTGKKADSSNPKTGDMILMPAAIMGTSVTALAVMFYLKKKRTV